LRRELEPLRRGRLVNLSVGTNTYAFARATSDSFAIVALNNSRQEQVIDLSIAGLAPHAVQAVTDRLGALGSRGTADGLLSFTLPPKSAALFTPDPVFAQTREAAGEPSETPPIAD
jgi:hypothetical protein